MTLGVFTNATGCQGGYVPAAEIEMMEPACTTACYVNAATGNDLWSGTLTQPKKTIQAAIDAVQAGGTVFVYPGTYSETAAGRLLFNNSGPYQFGLFIDKNGVKLQGVDAAGAEILGSNASAPFILTNATNSFGTSGIFVQGDNVVIDGVRVGPNAPGDNKTIEVIGENFTLADSVIDVPGGGSVYINDWRYVAGSPATCHVNKYTISGNIFKLAASLDISSGAGACTAASDRQILNNAFESDAGQYWPQISFNGTVPAVGWFVHLEAAPSLLETLSRWPINTYACAALTQVLSPGSPTGTAIRSRRQ